MKILIEEYAYPPTDVASFPESVFSFRDKNGHIATGHVGYYYNHETGDCIFVLPKVIIDEQGRAFGKYNPSALIEPDKAGLEPHELKFIYEFAVWIHRAITVFNDTHPGNSTIIHRHIETEGNGTRKRFNTLLDVIISLLRFNRENNAFVTYVVRNLHSGNNKINWGKTLAGKTVITGNSIPVYLNPVNKKRQIDFDEELIVIFHSILNHISEWFGFKANVPFGFNLITGPHFEHHINGYGCRRLRRIKYKYFSDTALRLWELCYAFFDKAHMLRSNPGHTEYLLANNFNKVFEAMIDELIGDKDIPRGLKTQNDGKLVDHLYTYPGLFRDGTETSDIYYIGDSKYYRIGNVPGKESVYKQHTYARNVTQWNLDMQQSPAARDLEQSRFREIELRDDLTEGYNVIPNFFISAFIDPGTLSFAEITAPNRVQPPVNKHFSNRLYDRDTLVLSHFNVNFLFVTALYARNHTAEKMQWKNAMRHKLRDAVRALLSDRFRFYAMKARKDTDTGEYLETHFRDLLGKTFRPFRNKEIFSLALEQAPEFTHENVRLLAQLKKHFIIAECRLHDDPNEIMAQASNQNDIAE